jgi:hypothetical protein
VGFNGIYTFENDTGPDEDNHDWKGIFLANQPATSLWGAAPGHQGHQKGLHISQIGLSILKMFNNSH